MHWDGREPLKLSGVTGVLLTYLQSGAAKWHARNALVFVDYAILYNRFVVVFAQTLQRDGGIDSLGTTGL